MSRWGKIQYCTSYSWNISRIFDKFFNISFFSYRITINIRTDSRQFNFYNSQVFEVFIIRIRTWSIASWAMIRYKIKNFTKKKKEKMIIHHQRVLYFLFFSGRRTYFTEYRHVLRIHIPFDISSFAFWHFYVFVDKKRNICVCIHPITYDFIRDMSFMDHLQVLDYYRNFDISLFRQKWM